MSDSDPMTREDALLWLNDRLGEKVVVRVNTDEGLTLLWTLGELRHWRADADSEGYMPQQPREDTVGVYTVGDACLDLTDVAYRAISVPNIGSPWETLTVELAESVTVEIIDQKEARTK
jgi:hypothetical protein